MILDFLKSSYQKVKNALTKTRSFLGDRIKSLFRGKIDADTLEKLEQLFFEADLGVQTSSELIEKIKEFHKQYPNMDGDSLLNKIKEELVIILKKYPPDLIEGPAETPTVILIVGVNGNGKTTSVAKLAKRYKNNNKKVLIAAADTFRAAAMEQLEVWANRLNIDIVKGKPGSDPAAVTFDALSAAKARKADILIIDTAGRLHTKTDLMQELEKIKRSCNKVLPGSPHETLLILDATTGQNAIDQAKTFHKFTPITGIILTKLDGTARGGIVINIQRQLGLPIKFIGVGEGLDDLEPFNPENFVTALFD